MDTFANANRKYWDAKVRNSLSEWDIQGFLDDRTRLTRMVQADRHYLGDVTGKRLVHLQCHVGSDTLSWARLGADCVGVDYSEKAIAAACDLNRRAGLNATFVESDVHEAASAVAGQFDVVYTSAGVLCWLPSVDRWAKVVARLLKPGGVFYIREAHPAVWSLDDERADEHLVIARPYFETPQPKRWDSVPPWEESPELDQTTQYIWSHGLGEIVTSLIDSGLTIEVLEEHRRLLWQSLPFMTQDSEGWWRLPDGTDRLPLMYSILARKG